MPEYQRRLPHFQPDDAWLFLTWHLWGSWPSKADSGPLWLRHPPIADLVARAILIGAEERQFYELRAWVVMPNHVHLLLLPKVPVPVLMRWLKGSTARSANRILERTGKPFWQDESYDHYLRHARQIGRTVAYIEQNPVSAGLALTPEGWRWSSAGWQAPDWQAKPPAPPGAASS